MSMPPPDICDRARQTRDERFDGLFYTGVRSTHIFCRPICPARTPKAENIVYFPSAAAAASHGFRPCLRCRPELAPQTHASDLTIRKALAAISGSLSGGCVSVEDVARQVHVSPRHLRRLFAENLGATPIQVQQMQRLLLAKQLLSDTQLSMIDVAMASGFGSVRRFNDAFLASYGASPTRFRRANSAKLGAGLNLRLGFRPPYSFFDALEQLRPLLMPGVEFIEHRQYVRRLRTQGAPAELRVGVPDPERSELVLQASGIPLPLIQPIVGRVRRMFDLDADIQSIHTDLARAPDLLESLWTTPGRRRVIAWDPCELALLAVMRSGKQSPDRTDRQIGALLAPPSDSLLRPLLTRLRHELTTTPSPLYLRWGDGECLASLVAHFSDRADDAPLPLSAADFCRELTAVADVPLSLARWIAFHAVADTDASLDDSERKAAWRPWRAYGELHSSSKTEHLPLDRPAAVRQLYDRSVG